MDQPGSPAMVSDDGKDRLDSQRLSRDDAKPTNSTLTTSPSSPRLAQPLSPTMPANSTPTTNQISPCVPQSTQVKPSNPTIPKMASSGPAKSSKPRCPAVISREGKECRKLANRIVGKCDDCGKVFCSAHRYMEEHNCEMQALTKQKLFADNAEQLLKERTQVVRI